MPPLRVEVGTRCSVRVARSSSWGSQQSGSTHVVLPSKAPGPDGGSGTVVHPTSTMVDSVPDAFDDGF